MPCKTMSANWQRKKPQTAHVFRLILPVSKSPRLDEGDDILDRDLIHTRVLNLRELKVTELAQHVRSAHTVPPDCRD